MASGPPPAVRQLIGLGDGQARRVVDRGPERRVVLIGLIGAGAFLAAAAVARLVDPGGGSWPSLHLALAGGAGLAIAALLPHFTVSLAGARPAPWPIRGAGLALIGSGAATVVVSYPSGWEVAAAAGATAYLAGLIVSAGTAFIPARGGVGRRFGVVESAYALALANGVAAVSLAMLRLTDAVALGGPWLHLKPAHAWLNLVGFVSLVIAGTMIHLYPTVIGSRIRSRPALVILVGGIGLGAPLVALGYAAGSGALVQVGAVAVAAGAVALIAVAAGGWSQRGRWTTDPAWHLFTIGSLSAAIGWFVIGVAILLAGIIGDGAAPGGWSLARVVGPLIIGWTMQALIGAWSHLLPSVGPGDTARHARQREVLGRMAVPRLVGWNAGTALVAGGTLWGDSLTPIGLVLVGGTLLASLALLVRAVTAR